jgi:hypothetical protein
MRTRNTIAAKNAKKTAAAGKIAPTSTTTNLINDFRGVSDKESTVIDAPEEVIGKKVGEAKDDATSSSSARGKTLVTAATEDKTVEENVPTPVVLSKAIAIDKTAGNDAPVAAEAEDEYAPYFAEPGVLKKKSLLPFVAFEPNTVEGPTPFGDDDVRFVEVSHIFPYIRILSLYIENNSLYSIYFLLYRE